MSESAREVVDELPDPTVLRALCGLRGTSKIA
jgi:hypothetical protein